jgi:protocatechuate 3,4-dioxygenase beta subunit
MSGKPIAGIHIGLYGPAKPRIAASILGADTDAQGNYAIRTPPGKQYVYIAQAMGNSPRPHFEPDVFDGQTTIVNFDLSPDRSSTIRINGTVLNPSGQPVAGADVTCDDPDSPEPFVSTESAITDAGGHFQLRDVKAGSQIRVRSKDQTLATDAPISVLPQTHEITIRLSAGAQFMLIVKVTDVTGAVIPDASVQLTIMNGRFGEGEGQGHPVDANGVVSLESLWTDNRYFLDAQAPGYGVTQAKVDAPALANPGRQTLTLVLKQATSVIAGIVVDAQGKPAPGVRVDINDSKTGARSTHTDSQGHFSFNVVDDARHVLVYLPHLGDDQSKPIYATANAGQTDVKLTLPAAP